MLGSLPEAAPFVQAARAGGAPEPVLGLMLGWRSMMEKTRFTAPEALAMSGKAIWALAIPPAANATQKNTCN